jgi:hypothetical protein
MKYREVHTVVALSSRIFVFVSCRNIFLLFSCRRFHGFWDFGVLVIGTVSAREKTSDADVPEFHRSERLTRGPHFGSVSEFSCVEAVKCFVSFVLSFSFFVLCHTSPAPLGGRKGERLVTRGCLNTMTTKETPQIY